MLKRTVFAHSVPQSWVTSLIFTIFVIGSYAMLVGCTGDGGENTISSDLPTPAGVTTGQSLDGATGHTDFSLDRSPGLHATDGQLGRSDSSDDVPTITVTSTSSGAAVQLNWLHASDAESFGYRIYYGKQPAQEAGSCATYEASQAVDAPPATIAGLEPETIYYFAVKHFNDSDDACSEEIIAVTPPAQG